MPDRKTCANESTKFVVNFFLWSIGHEFESHYFRSKINKHSLIRACHLFWYARNLLVNEKTYLPWQVVLFVIRHEVLTVTHCSKDDEWKGGKNTWKKQCKPIDMYPKAENMQAKVICGKSASDSHKNTHQGSIFPKFVCQEKIRRRTTFRKRRNSISLTFCYWFNCCIVLKSINLI